MSCPSEICTFNSNYSAAENAVIPFGTIARRYGRNCQLDGNGINLIGAGYYDFTSSISFTPTASGPVTFQLMQDGTAVPGALVSFSGTAATTTPASLRFTLRNCGCNCNSVLTVTTSAAGIVDNMATVVAKK